MKKNIIIVVFAIATFSLQAQVNSIWKINWDMNAPIGQTADFIGKYSCRGMSVDASWFVVDNFALGASFSWGILYEKTDKVTTHPTENVTITGYHQKYNNFVPLLFNAEYYIGKGIARPYVGIGLGASWSETIHNIGLYQIYDKNWMFTLAPEVGVVVRLTGFLQAHVRVRYLQGFWKEGQDLQSFNISVGFAFGGGE